MVQAPSSHCLGSPSVPNTPSRFAKLRHPGSGRRASSSPPASARASDLFDQGNVVEQAQDEAKEEEEEEAKEEVKEEASVAGRRSKRQRRK